MTSNGSLVRGSEVVRSTLTQGYFIVDFDRDVSQCAVLGQNTDNSANPVSLLPNKDYGLSNNEVGVRDTTAGFYLVVLC